MSEMIERVAKAIDESSQPPGCADYSILMKNAAVAAIKAMREPTDAMVDAGDMWADAPGYSAKAWRAMIDAALK